MTTNLTPDNIPDCMSPVIGKWIITIQDRIPAEIRNSQKWKDLLLLAAGTGKEFEAERLALILDWMWSALSSLQPIADKYKFGKAWQNMIQNKTALAAYVASDAAYAAYAAAADAAADAYVAFDAYVAAYAAYAAANATDDADANATDDADAATATDADAATANANAARVATASAGVAADAAFADSDNTDFWTKFNPCDLLEKLIKVS